MIRIVSLFCGLGGFDLGALGGFSFLDETYPRLSTRIELAMDCDERACEIYEKNIGPAICADVSRFDHWPQGDLVIAGPPCQPYSAAGSRKGADDPRNLLPALLVAIGKINPKAVVVENVPSLCAGSNTPCFESFLTGLRNLGFCVDAKVLQAADFGVPQTRRRLFIVAIKEIRPAWPNPDFGQYPQGDQRKWITVRQAIAGMDPGHNRLPIRNLVQGERRYPTFGSGARRQHADRPFFTVKAQDTKSGKMYHPWFDRALTIPELLVAMGFPDDFKLTKPGPQLGNAVPPPLAYFVVEAVTRRLGQGPR